MLRLHLRVTWTGRLPAAPRGAARGAEPKGLLLTASEGQSSGRGPEGLGELLTFSEFDLQASTWRVEVHRAARPEAVCAFPVHTLCFNV